MKPPDVARRELVLQWLDKAAADFDAAEQLCAQGDRFREIIAFLCQQAVEKYLKAFLVRHQIEFPKTHDIAKLLDRVATVNLNMASRCETRTCSHLSEWKCDTRRLAGTSSRRRDRGDRHGPPGERCRDDLVTAVLRRRIDLTA